MGCSRRLEIFCLHLGPSSSWNSCPVSQSLSLSNYTPGELIFTSCTLFLLLAANLYLPSPLFQLVRGDSTTICDITTMSPISALLKLHSTGLDNLKSKRSPLEVYRQRNAAPSRSDSAIVQSSSEYVTESSPAGSEGTSPKLSRTPSFTSILKKWSEAFSQLQGSRSSRGSQRRAGPWGGSRKAGSFVSQDANSKPHESASTWRRSDGLAGNDSAPNLKTSKKSDDRPSSMESYVSASPTLKLASQRLLNKPLPSSRAQAWQTPKTQRQRAPWIRD